MAAARLVVFLSIVQGTENMRIHILTLFLLLASEFGFAQPSVNDTSIPIDRVYFHDKINATQTAILNSDYINDSLFTPYKNDEVNAVVTHAITVGIDSLQNVIEASKLTDNNAKIKYLRGLNESLSYFLQGYYSKEIPASVLPQFIIAFADAMDYDSRKQTIEGVINGYSYNVGSILIHSVAFYNNEGFENAKKNLTRRFCYEHPDKIMITLHSEPDVPEPDSLINLAARLYPEDVYSYAAASDDLSRRIHNNPDKLVQIITRMSGMTSGRQYFPFLDNIYHDRTTFEEIDSALTDSTKYFSLLVRTAIDYADRLRKKDTPISQCQEALYNKISVKAKQVYIYPINGLHDEPDNIRFRIIDKLSPEELYYAAVSTEDEIYTSSYVRGIYPRIWKQMKNPRSDSLLMNVRFDHFKKWVKMTANYNLLSDFLNKMNKSNAEVLMKAFVNGLDQTNSLEDAVDVADSYAAIDSNKSVRKLILSQIQYNLLQAQQAGNKRAAGIYNILNTMFLSLDSTNKINMSEVLGIPPVYYMPNAAMHDSATAPIVIQQFFYGDKDGMGIFASFIRNFSGNPNWKIEPAEKWVLISSTKGVPVRIYSNRALDENEGLDDDAQHALDQYLFDNNLEPSMVIHRGHSYYLPSTLDQLATSAKVILLGSCGAYQHLNKVLQNCPNAQIISSRQTGSGSVNFPMIRTIVEELRSGKDLNWPALWKQFSVSLPKEYFDDYVPPHKNLGAVLIMAYNKMKETEGLD